MTRTLPASHLQSPNRRMKASGKTRFHQSMDGYSDEALLWIKQENCPFNRRSRDGEHPLIAAAQQLHRAYGFLKDEYKSQLRWWESVQYPSSSGEARRFTPPELVAEKWDVFRACLKHTQMNQLDGEDMRQLLARVRVERNEGPADLIWDHLIEAGVPLHKLHNNKHVLTPAMWAVLDRYNAGAEGLEGWLRRDFPVDPNKGPGLFSALVFEWPDLRRIHKEYLDELVKRALERGMDTTRKPGNFTSSREALWKDNDAASAYMRTFRNEEIQYRQHSSIAAQVQHLNEGCLIAALNRQLQRVSDEDRIRSLEMLLKKTSDLVGKKDNSILLDTHFAHLQEILARPAQNTLPWKQHSYTLLREFFGHVWGRLAPEHEKIAPVLQGLLDKGVSTQGLDIQDLLSWPVRLLGSNQHGQVVLDALDFSKPPYNQLGWSDEEVKETCAVAWTHYMAEYHFDSAEKWIQLIKAVLPHANMSEQSWDKIEKSVFSQSHMGAIHTQYFLQCLKENGYHPSDQSWKHLSRRITQTKCEENTLTIEALLNALDGPDGPPPPVELFYTHTGFSIETPSSVRDHPMVPWTREQAEESFVLLIAKAARKVDINNPQWSGRPITPLQAVANALSHCGQGEKEFLQSLAKGLLLGGADYLKEPQSDTPWHADLPAAHPLHAVVDPLRVEYAHGELDDNTMRVNKSARRRM